jgi:hypothetical protein
MVIPLAAVATDELDPELDEPVDEPVVAMSAGEVLLTIDPILRDNATHVIPKPIITNTIPKA